MNEIQKQREDFIARMKGRDDGTDIKQGEGGAGFIKINSAGQFEISINKVNFPLGETLQAVVLSVRKSLQVFPPFDPENPQGPIFSTSPVIGWDDFCEDYESGVVGQYKSFKKEWDGTTEGKPKASTRMALYILPLNITKAEDMVSEGEADYTVRILQCGGFSINPQNEASLFNFIPEMNEKYDHISNCIVKFGSADNEWNGRTFKYTTFQDGGALPETMLNTVADAATAIDNAYEERQKEYRADLTKRVTKANPQGATVNPIGTPDVPGMGDDIQYDA